MQRTRVHLSAVPQSSGQHQSGMARMHATCASSLLAAAHSYVHAVSSLFPRNTPFLMQSPSTALMQGGADWQGGLVPSWWGIAVGQTTAMVQPSVLVALM
jgi:hypothetical protein